MAGTLTTPEAVNALLAIATGAVYGYVGARLSRRHIQGDGRLAWTLFVHWWRALALVTAGSAVIAVLPVLGVHDEALYLSYLHVVLLALCYLLFCLLYYLAYLFTGKRSLVVPIAAFYVGLYAFTLFWINSLGPYYDPVQGSVETQTKGSGPLVAVFVILLIGPIVAGAALYLRLFSKVEEPTQRYRIGMIGGTILLWFGSSFLAYVPTGDSRLGESDVWPIATRLIGLVAALLVLAAYLPPAWVRKRYLVDPIEETPTTRP